MQQVTRKPSNTERRPSIPFAAIGANRGRRLSGARKGCPCCGAALDVSKPTVDMETNTLLYGNLSVHLEPNEALILQKLTQRMPGVVAHDSLIGHVWALREPEDARNCIKQHVHHLRRKLAPVKLSISNIFAVGYRLVSL